MKDFFYISFIINFIIFSFVFSIEPPQDQYDCLDAFVIKFNLQYLFSKLPNGKYNFCQLLACDEESGNVTRFSLNNNNFIGYNNLTILPSDISCLPSIQLLSLTYFNISQDLLYYNFPQNVERIFNFGSYDCGSIDQDLPPTTIYSLTCKSLNGTRLKMSHIQNIKTFYFFGSFPFLDNDISTNNISFELLALTSMNYPNLSNIPKISKFLGTFSKDFVISSLSNFSTINSESIQVDFLDNLLIDFHFESNFYYSSLLVTALLKKPTSFIDLSSHNRPISMILSDIGNEFNIDGEIPIVPSPHLNFNIFKGNITVFPNLSIFNGDIGILTSNLSVDLPPYVGHNQSINLSFNGLTGTVDKSWCSSLLNVFNNNLYGELPSCFSCYLSDSYFYQFYFFGNNFSNFNQSLGCPSFAPKFKLLNSSIGSSFVVTGVDIGYDPRYWILNSNNTPSEYSVVSWGNEYTVGYSNYDLSNDEYFQITFQYPLPSPTFTFPIVDKLPNPTRIEITSNELLINGEFFSSYLGYSNQSVTIGKNQKCLIKETSFFNITCEYELSTKLTYPTIIKINNDNIQRSVIINPSQGEKNQMTCPDNCNDLKNDYCDLSKGVCVTLIECIFDCGLFGICNNQTGLCQCDSTHQGENCNLPFAQCPIGSNSLVCSGNFNCNNQTGVCDCVDKYTSDCSKPNQYISSVSPSSTDGGEASFIGWFGNIHSNLSLFIGNKQCQPITFNSSNEIKCIAPPGEGVFDIFLNQNDIEYHLNNGYSNIEKIKSCPNNCTNSNQGICNSSNGQCNCINNYYSFDCSLKRNNNNDDDGGGGGSGEGGGNNKSTVDPSTGITNITDSQVNFQIYFKNLYEIDFNGNIVNQYSLQSNWTFNKTKDTQENNIYKLTQTIQQSCQIITSIEEISKSKDYSFAGSTFILEAGSIKLTISISNYTYKSNLNTLQLQLISSVDNQNQESDCNQKETLTDEISTTSFKYIKISKDNRLLQGRFINQLLSDGRSTYLSTDIKSEGNSIIATLNLPHFVNQSIIDPDFSVLLETDFKSECDAENNRKWLIPIAVVVPVVSISCIGAIVYLLYRRKVIESPLKVKLKQLLKK